MSTTLDYYDANAAAFVRDTLDVDFTAMQERFLEHLAPGARILDFGCGSGRDSRAFLARGFQVDALDGCAELCRLAGAVTGLRVRHMLFEDFADEGCYDGIWACASILHVPSARLADILARLCRALRPNGVLYLSFKYGDFEGVRHGRYFTDMTEERLACLLKQVGELSMISSSRSGDVRSGRAHEPWLNVLARREA